MAANYGRIHRLLKILTLIQSDSGWTAQRLAEECGVTKRTIFRDLDMLEGAGIPYFHDSVKGGYTIRRDFFMPPVALTLDESLALIALGEHIGGKEQIPLTKVAARAIQKIRCHLPQSIKTELSRIDKHIAIQLARAGPHEGFDKVYANIRMAIAKRRTLRCKYESIERSLNRTKGEEEVFEFKPYSLFFSHRSWYVLGHHSGRGEIRCLKINRFAALEITKRPYKIPESFSTEDHLGNAWLMIRGKKSYPIEIEFDPEFAETIAETHWHRTQDVQWHKNGSITFRCTVDGLDEIIWWILGMGPHCIVHKPKILATRVQKLATALLNLYESGPDTRAAPA